MSVEDDPALNYERRSHGHAEHSCLGLGGDLGRYPAVGEAGSSPHPYERSVERLLQVAGEYGRAVEGERGVLEGHRRTVGQPEASDNHDAGAFVQMQGFHVRHPRGLKAGLQEHRGGDPPSAPHVLGEAHEGANPAVHGPRGDESALTAPSPYQPLGRQVLHRLPGGHAADRKLLGELDLGGYGVARRQLLDLLPEPALDLLVLSVRAHNISIYKERRSTGEAGVRGR